LLCSFTSPGGEKQKIEKVGTPTDRITGGLKDGQKVEKVESYDKKICFKGCHLVQLWFECVFQSSCIGNSISSRIVLRGGSFKK
jgi:hypothetical protein